MNIKQKFYTGLFFRTFFLQALWNFERLQNIGFLYILYPFLKKLYPDKEKRKEVLLRHTGFFNTNPYMASIIIPMVLNCEKAIASGENVSSGKPGMIKSLMAGPVAAIGDSFFWGTVRPFCVFVSIFLFMLCINMFNDISYFWIVPVAFICLYNIIHLSFRYWMLIISFKLDEKMIPLISKLEIKFLGDILRVIGVLTVAGSIFLYFRTFGFIVSVPVFHIFGYAMPEILMFSLILITGFLFGRIKPSVLFYGIMLICFIFGYTEL